MGQETAAIRGCRSDIAAVASYGAISGGFHQALSDIGAAKDWVTGEQADQPKPPHYYIQLVALDAKPGVLPPGVGPAGVHNVLMINMTGRNLGDPVVGIMGKATANLDDHHQVEYTHANRSIVLGTGVAFTTEAAVIGVRNPNQEMHGRIDATFLYGPSNNLSANSLVVRGVIGWEFVAGKWRLTFYNDGDSAIPFGMSKELRPTAPLPGGL